MYDDSVMVNVELLVYTEKKSTKLKSKQNIIYL
jgi:hypothetical protein